MIYLYHYFLCPSSRFIRMVLDEKKIEYQPLIENLWRPSEKFLIMNPAGFFPVIKTKNGQLIVGAQVIIEYFEEHTPNHELMPKKPVKVRTYQMYQRNYSYCEERNREFF